MGMDRINSGLPFVKPQALDKFQIGKKEQANSGHSTGASASEGAATPTTDEAQISETAHQLMDLRAAVDVGRAALEGLPEVREDKLAEVRQRLEQGYYNSPLVQDKVSGILSGVLQKMDED